MDHNTTLNLLENKDYTALSPQEKGLVNLYMEKAEYELKRQIILSQRGENNLALQPNPTTLPYLLDKLQEQEREEPPRIVPKINRLAYLRIAAAASLFFALGYILGFSQYDRDHSPEVFVENKTITDSIQVIRYVRDTVFVSKPEYITVKVYEPKKEKKSTSPQVSLVADESGTIQRNFPFPSEAELNSSFGNSSINQGDLAIFKRSL